MRVEKADSDYFFTTLVCNFGVAAIIDQAASAASLKGKKLNFQDVIKSAASAGFAGEPTDDGSARARQGRLGSAANSARLR